MPTVVGLSALLVTGWLTQHEHDMQQRDQRRHFDFGLRQAATRVEQRVASYEQMLRGVRGFFDASDQVSAQDFERYVDLLQSGADFAGLRSIGHAPLQAPGGTASAPVALVAPLAGARLSPPGGDLLARPALRAAMLQARDAGSAVITTLVRPDGPADNGEAGVLLFMALYAPGQPLLTAADRRRHLRGWVFATFRPEDLVSSLYGEGTPGLDLRIHDGTSIDAASRIYPPGTGEGPMSTARFDAQEYIGVAGHTWTLWARSTPAFDQQRGQDPARVIAVAGTGMAIVLAMLSWLLLTGRDRAHEAARQITRQLADSERQHRRIVETADEGIWMVDAQGRTTFANPALQRLLACGADQLLGRAWADFMDAPGSLALLADAPGTGMATEAHDICLRRPDGSTVWAHVSTSRITNEQGQPAGLLAMVTDISQHRDAEARRNMLEDQLRQSQKMEAIGTLAGGIAHDFNNILAAILGNVALVQQDLDPGHPAQPRLQQIGQAGARARSLVQQIAAFSRQQPQALVVQPLRPLVDEAMKLLRATLPARVTLLQQCSSAALPVAADATQLQQVLLNLCTNAWHALPGGAGHIALGLDQALLSAAQAERLGHLQPGPHAHLWVRDNGSGMDEATRQRIFEPFYTTKPVGQGTGLGLAVVHGIVASHGGAISVDSAPGQGSTFHLYFPLVQQTQAALAEPDHKPLQRLGGGEHVLYVDDDPVMGLMVETLLQRQGWRVTCVDNPEAALAQAQDAADPVAVVVTDFNMPGMSGLDLARALAASCPQLPVVITSGYITDQLRSESARIGVRQVLQKEHTLDLLGPLLQQLLADTGPADRGPAT